MVYSETGKLVAADGTVSTASFNLPRCDKKPKRSLTLVEACNNTGSDRVLVNIRAAASGPLNWGGILETGYSSLYSDGVTTLKDSVIWHGKLELPRSGAPLVTVHVYSKGNAETMNVSFAVEEEKQWFK